MLKHKFSNYTLECGTDEAGRGCLAGPVTAAAVILPKNFSNDWLIDSKQLSEKKRYALREVIESEAVAFAVSHVDNATIDRINILNASIKAMHNAIAKLTSDPDFVAVDGNQFKPYKSIPYKTIIKGDAKYLHIAAASILAKTYRDDFMSKLHDAYPAYHWKQNKGYPTKTHREAIKQYGITKHHRRSFQLLPKQYVLDL